MYLIIFLWNPLFGFFCVIKKIFAFSVGGLFSLSTHALTCLRRRRFRRSRKLIETVLPSNTIMPISFEASRRGTQRLIITIASEAPGLTKCWSPDWLEEQEEKGENIDRPNTKWAFEDHLVDEIKIIEDPRAPLHVGAGSLPDWLRNKKGLLALDTYPDDFCIFRCLAVHRRTVDSIRDKLVSSLKVFSLISSSRASNSQRTFSFDQKPFSSGACSLQGCRRRHLFSLAF